MTLAYRGLLLLLLALLAGPAFAQLDPLVVIPSGVPAYRTGSLDAADYDGDGDLDLIVTGEDAAGVPQTQLLRYDGRVVTQIVNSSPRIEASYTFVLRPIRSVLRGVAKWADFTGDGLPDLAISGMDIDGQTQAPILATELFANIQGISFAQVASLPGLIDSDLDWGDYDGDGDLDLLLAGNDGTTNLTFIYRNDGNNQYTDVQAGLTGVSLGNVRWGDYDGDGDLDALISGFAGEDPFTGIYRNDGGDTFTFANDGLPDLLFSAVDWADYDGDGDLDVALIGGVLDPQIILGETHIFRNDGGTFTEVETSIEGLFAGSIHWGDYDLDGDPDLFLMGQDRAIDREGQRAVVYRNDGNDTFTRMVRLRGVIFGASAWYDYNGDGRLDILMMGTQNNLSTRLLFEL